MGDGDSRCLPRRGAGRVPPAGTRVSAGVRGCPRGSSEFGLRQEKAVWRSRCFGVRVRRGDAGPVAGGVRELLSRTAAPLPRTSSYLAEALGTLALYCKTLSAVFGVWFGFGLWLFFFFFPSPPPPSFKSTHCHF